MSEHQCLRISAIMSIVAFGLLMLALIVASSGQYPASQELFEVVYGVDAYSAALANAAPVLRIVLFVDALFALAYTSAIGFAILAFSHRNRAVAWFAGLAIITVMVLDYAENIIMIQSMDLLASTGALGLAQITFQVMVSSLKWHGAAVALFSISFLLPCDSLIEKILVWGTRLGLAISVPLFVTNAFELRAIGSLLILLSMASGFILLAIVTWNRIGQNKDPVQ